jgi:hypothetical protein
MGTYSFLPYYQADDGSYFYEQIPESSRYEPTTHFCAVGALGAAPEDEVLETIYIDADSEESIWNPADTDISVPSPETDLQVEYIED